MKKLTLLFTLLLVLVASAAAQTAETFSIKTLAEQQESDGDKYWALKNKDNIARSLEQAGFSNKNTGIEKNFFLAGDDDDAEEIDAKWILFQKGSIQVYYYYSMSAYCALDAVEVVFPDKEAAQNFINTSLKEGLERSEYNSDYYQMGILTIYFKTPTTIHIEAVA